MTNSLKTWWQGLKTKQKVDIALGILSSTGINVIFTWLFVFILDIIIYYNINLIDLGITSPITLSIIDLSFEILIIIFIYKILKLSKEFKVTFLWFSVIASISSTLITITLHLID